MAHSLKFNNKIFHDNATLDIYLDPILPNSVEKIVEVREVITNLDSLNPFYSQYDRVKRRLRYEMPIL